jgi:hypothetical protein
MGRHSKKRSKKHKRRLTERMKNGGDSLPVFLQNGRLARSTLHPLVVDCVHGAKLPVFFWEQWYALQKTF